MRQVAGSALLLIALLLVTGTSDSYAERLPIKVYSIDDGLPGV